MKEIKLTQNKVTLVDDVLFKDLSQYSWYAIKAGTTFYAVRNVHTKKGKRILSMHRHILNLTDPTIICDHINGNGLDNQKENLRPCTQAQNTKNRKSAKNSSSKYLGVSLRKPWCAKIRVNGTLINIGCYNTEIEAAEAYDKAALEHHGKFANLNIT